jgi:hypothetical protein
MKRILIEVDEQFHTRLHSYARADRRTIRQIVMLALESYMAQNPLLEEGGCDEHEKS